MVDCMAQAMKPEESLKKAQKGPGLKIWLRLHGREKTRAGLALECQDGNVLARLALDKSPEVRKEAASSPYLPPSSMAKLTADPDAEVKMELAGNPKANLFVLSALSRDDDEDVRLSVLRNVHCPPQLAVEIINSTGVKKEFPQIPLDVGQIITPGDGDVRYLRDSTRPSEYRNSEHFAKILAILKSLELKQRECILEKLGHHEKELELALRQFFPKQAELPPNSTG